MAAASEVQELASLTFKSLAAWPRDVEAMKIVFELRCDMSDDYVGGGAVAGVGRKANQRTNRSREQKRQLIVLSGRTRLDEIEFSLAQLLQLTSNVVLLLLMLGMRKE